MGTTINAGLVKGSVTTLNLINQDNMSKKTYNDFFKKYGPNVHLDPIRFNEVAKLCQGKVLDIGCGTGDLSDFYKGEYVGVDISDVAVDMAKKIRRPDATFWEQDATSKSFDVITKYDTIVITEVLEHLKDDVVFFKNIEKVSKPNARLVIAVPNGDRVPDKDHVKEFTIPQLREKFKGLGKVKFYNWPGATKRILLSVDLGQKNDNLLSLVMPVKEEGKGLEKAILSCIDFVDNIVISVDDASTDKTIDIAWRYADVVKKYHWKDSFADARNFAQEGVKTKWILALDGHEYIEQYENIRGLLNKEEDGIFVKIILESGFFFYYPRVIRSNITWVKDVHNFPECKKIGKYKKFVIIHDRTGGQSKEGSEKRAEQREKMVVGILTQKVKENKKDYRSMFYLAQLYGSQNKTRKAIKYLRGYLKYSKSTQERWLAYYQLGKLYNKINKPKWALKFLKKAQGELPDRWEIEKRMGATYMFMKKYRKAMEHLVNGFNVNKADFMFNPEQKNNAQTWFFISECFFALKNYESAKIALKRAKKSQTDSKWGKLPKEQLKIIEESTK